MSVTYASPCGSVDRRRTCVTCEAVTQERAMPLFEFLLEVGAEELRHLISRNEMCFH